MNSNLAAAGTILLALLIVGTFVYHATEGWSLIDSFYVTSMTILTIGYADLVPTLPETRLFTVFFAFIGVGTLLYSLGVIVDLIFIKRVERLEVKIAGLKKAGNPKNKVKK